MLYPGEGHPMKKTREKMLAWLGVAGSALLIIVKWGAIVKLAVLAYRGVLHLFS
jgi:hypothetical protein